MTRSRLERADGRKRRESRAVEHKSGLVSNSEFGVVHRFVWGELSSEPQAWERPVNALLSILAAFACAPIVAALALVVPSVAEAQTTSGAPIEAQSPVHDGAHDFDFVIGRWKAHLRRLPDRLVGSTRWIDYYGTSDHRKLLGSNANLEEFDVRAADGQRIKAETLRLYNPDTRQWSIYLLDLERGTLTGPPTVGAFEGNRGILYDREDWKGRPIIVRYMWFNISPRAARMEQAFSADEGTSWETNWICELSR